MSQHQQKAQGLPQPKSESKRRQRIVSIRVIISAATVALTACSVLMFAWVAERNGREVLTTEIENRLWLEARNLSSLSSGALLTTYPELTLCPLVLEMQSGRDDLALVAVLDHAGKLQGYENHEQIGQDLTLLGELAPEGSRHELAAGEALLGNSELLVASAPVVHANGKKLGRAVVGLRKPYIDGMVARLRENYLLLTAVLLTAGITVALLLMSSLLRPVAVLRKGLEQIGRGNLDTPLRIKDRTEFGLLAESVNGMATQLKASQAEMLEKERLDHEMDLAHSMQQSLLPEEAVRVGDLVCAGTYRAAAEVGGDFFDVFPMEDQQLGVVVADVSGKGLRGCLVTSMLAVLISSLRKEHSSPSQLLVALEESLTAYLSPGMFVTIFYGILDSNSGRMTYASAAHCPLLIHRKSTNKGEWFHTKGIPLGAVRGGMLAKTLTDETVDLEPGDLMLLYTDGLNEAWHPQRKEEFGFDRIAHVVGKTVKRGSETVLAGLEKTVMSWTKPDPLGDDLTIVTVEREATREVKDVTTPTSRSAPVDNPPLILLHEMLDDVNHVTLPSDLTQLDRLRDWLEQCPEFLHFDTESRVRVESALFEVCANLIEHGYQGDTSQTIDLWWLPTPTKTDELDAKNGGFKLGYFIICDQGQVYNPAQWQPTDMADPQIRRRGRGLGLNIVHSSTRQIVYSPSTPAGNITMLRFSSLESETAKETSRV